MKPLKRKKSILKKEEPASDFQIQNNALEKITKGLMKSKDSKKDSPQVKKKK